MMNACFYVIHLYDLITFHKPSSNDFKSPFVKHIKSRSYIDILPKGKPNTTIASSVIYLNTVPKLSDNQMFLGVEEVKHLT